MTRRTTRIMSLFVFGFIRFHLSGLLYRYCQAVYYQFIAHVNRKMGFRG